MPYSDPDTTYVNKSEPNRHKTPKGEEWREKKASVYTAHKKSI